VSRRIPCLSVPLANHWHQSHVTATFIHQLLMDSTLSQHIHTVLQPTYARRYHNMMNALHEHVLPLGVTMPQADRDVAGGYFVWLTLPKELDSDLITKKALHEGLVIASGTSFRVQGDPASEGLFIHEIRLCFSWAEEDLIEEGIQRLARVIKREMAQQ
jgi:DNA-binding transcriptional MocR family regulator